MQSPTRTVHPQTQSTTLPPHVCVIGGGFGGLYTALYLHQRCQRQRQPCTITLIEPRDRFVFTPLLYELLTDEVKPWEIGPTYADLLRDTDIRHRQTQAEQYDLTTRRVTLADGHQVAYDYLVIATGSRDRDLPIRGWSEQTYRFRTFEDVHRLDDRLAHLQGQGAGPITVAVVGGGPSGVELSCKLADRLGQRGQIALIERGDRILKPYSDRVRRAAMRALAQRKVNIHLQTEVAAVEPKTLYLSNGEGTAAIAVDIVVGVAGTELNEWLGPDAEIEHSGNGSIQTRSTLQLPNYPEVFVAGDQAQMPWHPDQPAPQTAQAAYQAAAAVAKNLVQMMQGRSPKAFHYQHLGDMMCLGHRNALVAVGGLVLKGWLPGIIRQAAYTYRLPPGGHHRWHVVRYRCGRIWHWIRH